MEDQEILLDTVYIQALLDKRDQFHDQALKISLQIPSASEIWVTEAVLTEVANALGRTHRSQVIQLIKGWYDDNDVRIVNIDKILFQTALTFYEARPDKSWGLTDCISFVVMREQNITLAVTADIHFVQAGFRALMQEDE